MKEPNITRVEVKKIKGPNSKKGLAGGVLDHLHDSISKEGLLNPICLRPAPENPGLYKIVAGQHRFYVVAKMMKEEVIDARIFDEMSDEEAELAGMSENACRTHAKPTDRLLNLRKWQEVYRKHFPLLEGKRASGHTRWANSTKAIEEERARDAAEAAAEEAGAADDAGCDDQNEHRIEGDQATAEKARPKTFRERVKAVTGMSDSALTRDLKINNSLSEEQVYVLDLAQCTKQGMIQIIDATSDTEKRGDIVNLVASGMEIDLAIVEVLGPQASKIETKEVGEVEPKAEPETEEEWFRRECGEFAGYLSDPDQYHADAILYRRIRDERHEHRQRIKRIYEDFWKSRKGKRLGGFYWTVFSYLNASHPNSWVICGTCKGMGTVDGKECPACRGAGYKPKAERYI